MRSRGMVLCSVTLLAVTCTLAVRGSAPAAAAPASPLVMLEYTWTGLGNDDLFDHWCNWDTTGCPSEGVPPDGTDDNATFPAQGAGPWAVDLITEEIGDLAIQASVDFDTAGGTVTLEVDQFVIDASSGDISVSAVSDATIKTP